MSSEAKNSIFTCFYTDIATADIHACSVDVKKKMMISQDRMMLWIERLTETVKLLELSVQSILEETLASRKNTALPAYFVHVALVIYLRCKNRSFV